MDTSAGPAGELAGGGRGAFEDRGDLFEGHGEDVVQDEGEALSGSEGVEHDHQRRADRVGQQGPGFWVGDVVPANRRPGGGVGPGLLAASPAGAQHLQAFPGDHSGQPSGEVVDIGGVGATEPQPRVLHGVVCLRERAEHPVGHRPQVALLLLEALGQPVGIVHRSHSPVPWFIVMNRQPPRK